MADEPQLTSKKRKVPDADQKKFPRKKVKATGVVATANSPALRSASSPIPNPSISKIQRQRRPTQRNASPGPSSKPIPQGALSISSTSVVSVKKRGRSPDPESDWSPPSVPSLKSGRIRKPTFKSLASITIPFKPPPIPRKSQMKTLVVKRRKIIPTEVIEILSSEDEALPLVPRRKQQESIGSHSIIRAHKPPSPDVIDLCSDDDHSTTKSSPVRTENKATVILSSDDETSSKAKSRRPTRLIKRTSKAQALLDDQKGVKVSPAGAKGRSVLANSKRSRPSKATPVFVIATPDPKFHKSPTPDNDQNTAGPNNVTNTPTSTLFAENEDGREEDEGPGLQQAIYDTFTQDAQEYPADDIAPHEVVREDEGVHDEGEHVAVADNGDAQAFSEGLHSLPVQPIPKSAAHSESPPTHPQTLLVSSDPNLPLSESASRTKSPSPPVSSDSELQPVLDTTSDTEPALQDAILLSLIWQEGDMENNPADTPSVRDPDIGMIGMIDPVPPSPKIRDELADPTPNDVENTSTQPLAIPLFLSGDSYKNTDEVEGSSALLELPTQFLPENVDGEDEDLGLQNALMASLTQEAENVLGVFPPMTMDMSGNGHESVPSKPFFYSETIAPDDMSTYLPPHLSHVPSPLPDLYGDSEDDDPDGLPSAVQVSMVEQPTVTAVDTSVVGGPSQAQEPTSIPAMNDSKSWPDEPNAAMDSAPDDFGLQSGDEEEIEDVQMQRAMFQSLVSNTERSEAVGPGDEQRATGGNEEELKDDPPPIATPPTPTPVVSPLERDSPGVVVQRTSKSSPKLPFFPQLSAHSTTPDNPSSSLDDSVSSSEIHTILSHGVRKPSVSYTYSSEPVTTLPRLLTPSFFAQSFLPPNHQLDSRKTVTATLSNVLPPQNEPQTSELPKPRSPTPPDVPSALSEHGNSDPNKMNGPEIIPSLETKMQPDSTVQAHSPSIASERFSSEEVEVDLELTDPESFDNVPILAAALSESKILMELLKDVQQRASGSPAGDHAVNVERDLSCGMQPHVEESSSVAGSDSLGIQQGDVTSAERDNGMGSSVDDHAVNLEHELSCAEQPQVERKSSECDGPGILQNYIPDAERDNDAGSSTGDPAADSQHELSDAELEEEFSPALGSDSPGVQQSDVSGAEGDKDVTHELENINSEQPRQPGNSLSQSSLDSSATTEDSPPPTTPPVRSSSFDFSSFFIRSSSPVDFNHDVLKNFVEISLPTLLDKDTDEDAYLLSTHSFDYPDDVGVV